MCVRLRLTPSAYVPCRGSCCRARRTVKRCHFSISSPISMYLFFPVCCPLNRELFSSIDRETLSRRRTGWGGGGLVFALWCLSLRKFLPVLPLSILSGVHTPEKKKKTQMSVQIFVVVEITVLAELCYLPPGGIVLGSILRALDAMRSSLVCTPVCSVKAAGERGTLKTRA